MTSLVLNNRAQLANSHLMLLSCFVHKLMLLNAESGDGKKTQISYCHRTNAEMLNGVSKIGKCKSYHFYLVV